MTAPLTDFPSLITSTATAGLTLAGALAERLHTQIQAAHDRVERPGGTNYRLSSPVPVDAIASVPFYAIAAANHGWEATR
jgi:hypothetical protein